MNNNQKKLFNIANRIEKLMFDVGVCYMEKKVGYACIVINLNGCRLTRNFIEPLSEITKKYNINFEIEFNTEPRIKIY